VGVGVDFTPVNDRFSLGAGFSHSKGKVSINYVAGTSQDHPGSRLVLLDDLLAPDYGAHVGLITARYRWQPYGRFRLRWVAKSRYARFGLCSKILSLSMRL
ncbi:MAG: hypothetical protein RQ826_08740, partial [Xanthomonadales bacterium]|nr:hypothetical protein [Xanthomonadales bacterium]